VTPKANHGEVVSSRGRRKEYNMMISGKGRPEYRNTHSTLITEGLESAGSGRKSVEGQRFEKREALHMTPLGKRKEPT